MTGDDLRALADECRAPTAHPANHLRQIGDKLERMAEAADRAARPGYREGLEESYIKLQAEWLATTKELGEARVAVEFARREALEEAAKVARDFAKAPARNLLRRGMGLPVWAASKPLALQAIRTCAAIRALAQKEG
ncbi:hypothetical protein GCM10011390_42150 [Aureimonas endophytica]|uniref:Uncharacterized protein n=1 Tax=Aureimonas endophytica TaxID=2027858 RepID=A0A917EA57_9HYPH|nr:hypothetical protein [Aureimonas endophytica]GGE18551.1 hypothetical protein GCM10011390_42150 [Aureimonas endophytica]